MLRKTGIGSIYPFTFWNAAALLGCILACIEATTCAPDFAPLPCTERNGREAVPSEEVGDGEQTLRGAEEAGSSETTPLLQTPCEASPAPARGGRWTVGSWILQLLVSVPFPVVLFFHITVMVLGGQSQLLIDGVSPALGEF